MAQDQYKCDIRHLPNLTERDNVGSDCYLGNCNGDCTLTGEYCTILQQTQECRELI
jgi:hypothetical protein